MRKNLSPQDKYDALIQQHAQLKEKRKSEKNPKILNEIMRENIAVAREIKLLQDTYSGIQNTRGEQPSRWDTLLKKANEHGIKAKNFWDTSLIPTIKMVKTNLNHHKDSAHNQIKTRAKTIKDQTIIPALNKIENTYNDIRAYIKRATFISALTLSKVTTGLTTAFIITNMAPTIGTPQTENSSLPPINPPAISLAKSFEQAATPNAPISMALKIPDREETQETYKTPQPHKTAPNRGVNTAAVRATFSQSIENWTRENNHKRYKWGHNTDRLIDCSNFVMGGLRHANHSLKKQHGTSLDLKGIDTISSRIVRTMAQGGKYIEGSQVNAHNLKAAMVIGIDSGYKKWDRGRFHGIDHIAVTFRNKNGHLYVAESSSGTKGVKSTPIEKWLNFAQKKGYKLYAADVLNIATTSAESAPKIQMTSYQKPSIRHQIKTNTPKPIQEKTEATMLEEFRHQAVIRTEGHQGIESTDRKNALAWLNGQNPKIYPETTKPAPEKSL